MEPCSLPDAESDFDRLVAATAHELRADPICSTSDWIVPAAAAFAAEGTSHVFRSDRGMVALLEHENPRGPVFTALDAVWGFATPLVGPDASALVDELARGLLPTIDYYALTLSGIDPTGPLFEPLQALNPVGYTETADRCVADLAGGFDAWLGRRSSRFRRSLRSAVNRAESDGVVIDAVRPTQPNQVRDVLERVMALEATSWKTDDDSGLIDTALGFFTTTMSRRFARTADLRVMFAQLDGSDIGYVLGARRDDRYRGFQHSFDQRHAHRSIGKVLQFHNIAALAGEGVTSYDMGMHMDYKDSYTDRVESTITLIFAKR